VIRPTLLLFLLFFSGVAMLAFFVWSAVESRPDFLLLLTASLVFVSTAALGNKKTRSAMAEAKVLRLDRIEAIEKSLGLKYPKTSERVLVTLFVGVAFAAITAIALLETVSIPIGLGVMGSFLAGAFGVVWGAISDSIASSAFIKGRRYWSFYILSLLLSPILIGLVVTILQAPREEHPTSSSLPPRNNAGSNLSKIEELAGLKAKGLISEDEFQAKKKQLLEDF